MTLTFPDNILPRRVWRFNSRLLADEEFVAYMSNQIDFYLETNQTPDVCKHTLWEAMKAFLRGQIISYSASVNKKRMERTNQLISRINAIDQEHSQNPRANLATERVALQTELDTLNKDSSEELYLRSRQKVYEFWERASKLLCQRLRQATEAGYIAEIESPHGITTDQVDINNQFKKFYEDLYSSGAGDGPEIDSVLMNLDMPTISEAARGKLEQLIVVGEIDQALKGMKSGKAPGPDGFPIEFYKKFSAKLIPILRDDFCRNAWKRDIATHHDTSHNLSFAQKG